MRFDYYLGANTPEGFVSYFTDLTDTVSHLYILKGGPGCGKSTAMKRIADACSREGMEVQRIWCSSDADSLDGVYIADLDTMYVDGTAPHVIEPGCPGARDVIVNFGDCWDEAILRENRTQIEAVSASISACYRRAWRYLRAAGALAENRRAAAQESADLARIQRRARRITERHIPQRRNVPRGRQIDVFLGALTPQGPVFLNRFEEYAVSELHDGAGLYPLVTSAVLENALSSGYTVYAARDPMFPHDAPIHLVIPELRYALLTSGGTFGCAGTGMRRIRLDKLTDSAAPGRNAVREKEESFVYDKLIEAACTALSAAKRLHDELEDFYRPAVDFQAVDAITERCSGQLIEEFRRKKRDARS